MNNSLPSCIFSVVAFRKSNKIGFFIKVIPQREEGDVTVAFKLRHDFRNLTAPIRPTEEGEATSEAIWLTHHVELSLGPLATWKHNTHELHTQT